MAGIGCSSQATYTQTQSHQALQSVAFTEELAAFRVAGDAIKAWEEEHGAR
ncbi:hypothetical protein D3C78_1934980 [compost metagenome]